MNKKDFLHTIRKLKWFVEGQEPHYRSAKCLETFMKAYPNVVRPSLRLEPKGSIYAVWGRPGSACVEMRFTTGGMLEIVHAVGIERGLRIAEVDDFAHVMKFLGCHDLVFGVADARRM